ncbi:hypothetical protein [Herbidospora cretacea]|uniref:hypothetical protein n=1 Tax=Herbidospora cretacea TaxID=28444 RepID=UPI0007744B1E|nr:hypothetical protein [Herbidospora cretacea]
MDKPEIRVGRNVNGPVIVGDGNRVTIHRSPYLWIVLTVLVVMGAATIFLLLTGDDEEPPAAADKPAGIRPGAYTVILEGSAAGGAPFTRQGELRIRRSAGGQPFDWCLKVGNPVGTPAPGAIWFATNASCFGGGEDDVYARWETDGTTTVLTPVRQTTKEMNFFTVASGVTATAYTPDQGEIRFEADGARLEGAISLQGVGEIGPAERGVFTATLDADQISDDPEALISSPVDPPAAETAPALNGSDATGTRYSVQTVISLDQLKGDPDDVDSARARIAGAVFVIDERDGGDFVYAPADSRTDLFPVEGRVASAEPVYVVSAEAAVEGAEVTVGGTFDRSGAEPVITLTVTSTFFAGVTSYEFKAILRPV